MTAEPAPRSWPRTRAKDADQVIQGILRKGESKTELEAL